MNNKNRPFLRFGFSIIVTLGAIVSAYTTYHGMVSTINISTNTFKFFIGLLMLFFILFQVWMWEFLLSKTLLNWLIDQKFEDDFEYVRKNTDKKLFVFFSVLPLFILFNFSI